MGNYGRISTSAQEQASRRKSRDLPGATETDPTGKAAGAAPVENVGAGNTGFERFLALHRGNRGGRTMSSKTKGAYRYTGGKHKGMTQGEVDIQAHRQFQKMSDKQRDQFRPMNEGDFAKKRERNVQLLTDEAKLAKKFDYDFRNRNPTGKPKTPETEVPEYGDDKDGDGTTIAGNEGATGATGAPGTAGKPGRRIDAAGGRPIGRGRKIGLSR